MAANYELQRINISEQMMLSHAFTMKHSQSVNVELDGAALQVNFKHVISESNGKVESKRKYGSSTPVKVRYRIPASRCGNKGARLTARSDFMVSVVAVGKVCVAMVL